MPRRGGWAVSGRLGREVSGEGLNHLRDNAGGLVEVPNSKDRFSAVRPNLFGGEVGITKSYAGRRLALHLHFVWRSAQFPLGNSEQFCAILHANVVAGVLTLRTPYPTEFRLYEFRDADGGQDQAVLVEIVQSPDGVDEEMRAPRLKISETGRKGGQPLTTAL